MDSKVFGVYNKLKAAKVDGKWSKSNKTMLVEGKVLEHDYVKAQEQVYVNSGIYYELDEKATAKLGKK